MLGDDPDLTLPYMFGDESISVPDSDSAGDIESQQSNPIGGSNSLSDGVIVTQPLGITQTTQTRRKIQLIDVSETDLDIWLGGFHINPLWLYAPIDFVVPNLRH